MCCHEGVTQPVTPCDVSHVGVRHNNPCSQQITTKYPAIRALEYKVIRESITGPSMGPGPAWLTLTLLLKYLAQCETINYVWYISKKESGRGPTLGALYLPRAALNSTCWSVNFQKAIDMNLCEGSEHSAHRSPYEIWF